MVYLHGSIFILPWNTSRNSTDSSDSHLETCSRAQGPLHQILRPQSSAPPRCHRLGPAEDVHAPKGTRAEFHPFHFQAPDECADPAVFRH